MRISPVVRQKTSPARGDFMNKKKEAVIFGFALFAMFFGAGNLIFPPSLGIAMGKDWFLAGIGFLLTGVGLPYLAFWHLPKSDGLKIFP